jgi:hypothetical protein
MFAKSLSMRIASQYESIYLSTARRMRIAKSTESETCFQSVNRELFILRSGETFKEWSA